MTPQKAQLVSEITKVFFFASGAFILAMALTPVYTYFAYKYKWWKRVRKETVDKKNASIFYKLHAKKHERGIPTMVGFFVLIPAILIITLIFNLDRSQTYLPLFTIVVFSIMGAIDDYTNVKGIANRTGGNRAITQILAILSLSFLGAWWFYEKLGWSVIHIPAWGNLEIGWLYIPLFVIVIFASAKSVGITDGLDGLSGGLLSSAYFAYALIAFFQGNIGIAAFCATVVGVLLVYTWFNIYPARFFMGNSGAVPLGATLGVIAMLTNSVFVLPVIGFVFFVESGSSAIQLLSKKFRGKKIFLSAPIHHHFEAMGWPETKVTMRFWIIGGVMAIIGIIIGLLGKGV